jgi:hypothetical protein
MDARRPKAVIGPSEAGLLTGLLLVPSVVGEGLFGAADAPPPEVQNKFGTTSVETDISEGKTSVSIDMPFPPHPELGRLIVCYETIEG